MRAVFFAFASVIALSLPAAAENAKVAVTAIVEHPALDAARDGVRDALAEAGYRQGENLTFVYESAQGNPATATQIARQFIGDNPSVIVPISTPSAQAVVSATRDIPVVFTAVSDPLGAQLVRDLDKPGRNVTGLSDRAPVAAHIALIREILPEAKSIGFIYNSGEANSVSALAEFKAEAAKAGFAVIEAVATRSSEVQGATRSLAGRADAAYVPLDNTIVSALEAAVAVAVESRLPLFSADTASVDRGSIAALGFNYYDVGKQTGAIVARVLKGEKPGDIPVRVAAGTDLVINKAAAEKTGVTLPDSVVSRATRVIE